MSIYFITGKLGSGKTLVTVGKIRDALLDGRRVATNLDIYTDKIVSLRNKSTIIRLPDKPRASDLRNLGRGTDSVEEEDFGIIVLDECGTWLNTRTWNDPERKEFIDWLLHARKLGWHVYFIVQDISLIDKQARLALCEFLVVCKRLDRVKVPFFSLFYKLLFDKPLTFPKIHIAKVYYGDTEQSMLADRWTYRARDLYCAYDTNQVFTDNVEHNIDMRSSYTLLSAWHLSGRYLDLPTFKMPTFFELLLIPGWSFILLLRLLLSLYNRYNRILT